MNLINYWTHSIYKILFSSLTIEKQEKEKIIFTMEVLLSETTKMLILISTFLVINKGPDIFFILLFSIPLRIHLGGFHMKKYSHCLLFSLSYCALTELLAYTLNLNTMTILGLSTISLIIIIAIAPVIPIERSQIKSLSRIQLKRRAIIITVIYMMIYILWPNSYTQYAQWTIIIQTLIILIFKGDVFNERKIINSH